MTKRIFPDRQSLIEGSAEFITNIAEKAVKDNGRFTIALSGGNTPKPLYERLAAAPYLSRISWARTHVFFGDERVVPPSDSRSNYLMTRTALLDHVPIPPENIHRMAGELDPQQAAAAYSMEVENVFGRDVATNMPSSGFDLVLLGIGDNGHFASIFPGLPAVYEKREWVMAQYVEVVEMWRITLTPVVINAARNAVFLVEGADKASVLQRIIEGPSEPVVLPAQIVKPTKGEVTWLLDEPAAAKLVSK